MPLEVARWLLGPIVHAGLIKCLAPFVFQYDGLNVPFSAGYRILAVITVIRAEGVLYLAVLAHVCVFVQTDFYQSVNRGHRLVVTYTGPLRFLGMGLSCLGYWLPSLP